MVYPPAERFIGTRKVHPIYFADPRSRILLAWDKCYIAPVPVFRSLWPQRVSERSPPILSSPSHVPDRQSNEAGLYCSTAVCRGFTHKDGSAWKLCCPDLSSPMNYAFGVRCSFGIYHVIPPLLSSQMFSYDNSTPMFALVALGGAGGLAASDGDSSFLLGR